MERNGAINFIRKEENSGILFPKSWSEEEWRGVTKISGGEANLDDDEIIDF